MRVDLFAIQPYMSLADYASEEAFYAKLDGVLALTTSFRDRASQVPALAVLPEDLATFLVMANRTPFIETARTVDEAFSRIGKRLWPAMLATMARYRTRSLKEAFFTWAATDVWTIWHRTISQLAKKYHLTLVAGSGLVPNNLKGPQSLSYQAESARVYNYSFTVIPTGDVVYETRKVNLVPTQEDVLGLTQGPLEPGTSLYGWETIPTATTICYDGFRVPHTGREPSFTPLLPILDRKGARLIAQPSANPWSWDAPWIFQNHPESGRLRCQQWLDEGAMSALMACKNIEVIVNPQLLLRLLDVHFEGRSMILVRSPEHGVKILAQSRDFVARPESEEVLHATWDF